MLRSAAVKTARAVLPGSLYARLRDERDRRERRREIRYPPAVGIDLRPLERLRALSPEQLTDAAYLEHEVLPALGLNDEHLEEFPRELDRFTGTGLRFWQYPSQYAPYLVEVARHRPRSYLEIGVRHGGTFALTTEYLARLAPLSHAFGIDILASPGAQAYARSRPHVRVARMDSNGRRFALALRRHGPFDLALIDGDHDADPVRRDFERVQPHARMLAFHDIANPDMPGLRKVWDELKASQGDRYEFHEFVAQYDDVLTRMGRPYLGLGLAVDRGWSASRTGVTNGGGSSRK
jgi:cephalosporin hydroxylase